MNTILPVHSRSALVFSDVNKGPDVTPKFSELCTQLAYETAACIKRFGLGVAAAGVITPLTEVVSYLARLSGLVPEVTAESNMRGMAANYQSRGYIEMHADNLVKASCYVEELVKQLNLHVVQTPDGLQKLNYNALTIKVQFVADGVIYNSIRQEVLLRWLIQDICLTQIPKYVIKKIAPGRETALDTTIARATRILLTSAAFSLCHLRNQEVGADSYVTMQLVATFAMGIGFGLLKESKAGLLGSIGAHMANNVVVSAPMLWGC